MAVGDTEPVGPEDIHTEQDMPDGEDTQEDGVPVGALDMPDGEQDMLEGEDTQDGVPDMPVGVPVHGVQDMDSDGEVMETVYMEDYMELDGVDYMVDTEDGDGHTEVMYQLKKGEKVKIKKTKIENTKN